MLRHRIEAVLRIPRPVIVADRDRPEDTLAGPTAESVEGGVFIEAALSDGHWLLFRSDLGPPPVDAVATRFSQVRFAAWLSLSILLGVLLSTLAARRLVKPLSELTAAAERTGGSGDAPPLPPRGPREVRATIEAFNRMQERLRRFNEDRTRMIAAMSHDLRDAADASAASRGTRRGSGPTAEDAARSRHDGGHDRVRPRPCSG